jgi:hypothetical protein
MNSRRQMTGNVLILLGALLLFGSAGAKLAHVPRVVSELSAHGFADRKLMIIGALEITCALLFVIRYTRSAGLLLVSAYMGGAIATHVGRGTPWIPTAIVLSLLWLGAYLRHPMILWSFAVPGQDAHRAVRPTVELQGK